MAFRGKPQRLRRGKGVEGVFTTFPSDVAFVHPDAKGHQNAANHVAAAMLDALGVN
ncbi:hypothetical protein [Streptomyces sp. NPDC059861]|uniref:hypothetical protein n=1 Tax=Streptomyces sp. NPDC059861 TaxID=3346974 RepID=UPI00364B2774